jgi:phosphoribosyl 1,2-cyclic phosphate phosphodiesterase
MKITVLGCGSSGGIPTAGGDWGRCDPAEPRNRRLRPAVLLEAQDTVVLIDTGPDLRQQLLTAGQNKIDAILYTHHHADHTHGFDDIRYLNMVRRQPMPIYGLEFTIQELQTRFAYAFEQDSPSRFYRPQVIPQVIRDQPFTIGALTIQPFVQDHGSCESLGFRFGPFAYSTDVRGLDETAFSVLQGIEVWIVDALREEPHPLHSHLAQTLDWIARLNPRQAYLTHMNHLMDYRYLLEILPEGVAPAYDGLVIEF